MSRTAVTPRSGPFAALANGNYRLYFFGQTVSTSGTFMQRVGQAWLVLDLSGSPLALGTVTALQYLPTLALGLTAGVVADRLPKRRLLMATQIGALVQAALLSVLTLTGAVQLWHVYVFALLLGCVNAFDNTARSSFVSEMVEPEVVQSAVSLNSSVQNLARILGPAIGGVIVAAAGPGWCFASNTLSYLAMLAALGRMRTDRLHPSPPPATGHLAGQLAAGLRYARSEPELTVPLVLQAFVGTFGLNLNTVLPLLARFVFDVGPTGLGFMTAAQGVGAVMGSLIAAGSGRPRQRRLIWAALAFAALLWLLGAAPLFALALVLLLATGLAQVIYTASVQTTLQLTARPEYRGRVLSIYSLVHAGVTPAGATFIGVLADSWGVRAAIQAGALLCVVGAGVAGAIGRRQRGRAARP